MSADDFPSLADKSPCFAMKLSDPSVNFLILAEYDRQVRKLAAIEAYLQTLARVRETCQERDRAAE